MSGGPLHIDTLGASTTRTGSNGGLSQVLEPDTSLSGPEMITKCVQGGFKIPTQYDVWLGSDNCPDPTSDEMLTVFNNTIYTFRVRIYPIALNEPQNKNKDLYLEALEDFEVSPVNPTTTVRLDNVFTISIQSAQDMNGRIYGPFTSDAASVEVYDGRGSFRIRQVNSEGYVIVPEDSTPDPEANTVVIRSNCQGVTFNLSVCKNNKLWQDFIIDPLSKKLEFSLPNCYLMKVYIWYIRNKSYEECTKSVVSTGEIAFIQLDSQQKPKIWKHGNRSLLAIPTEKELQKISGAYNLDVDMSG